MAGRDFDLIDTSDGKVVASVRHLWPEEPSECCMCGRPTLDLYAVPYYCGPVRSGKSEGGYAPACQRCYDRWARWDDGLEEYDSWLPVLREGAAVATACAAPEALPVLPVDDQPRPEDPLAPSWEGYKRPRPKLLRLCTINWSSSGWPDQGRGVWRIDGFTDLGERTERFTLRRVMPAMPGGASGETISFWRGSYEAGGLTIWRKGSELVDPAYGVATQPKLCNYCGVVVDSGMVCTSDGEFNHCPNKQIDEAIAGVLGGQHQTKAPSDVDGGAR